MRVSGYGESCRFDIIKGAEKRHRELLILAEKGEIQLYRNKMEIKLAKQSKGGGAPNTWYLKGGKTSTFNVPATPGGTLKKLMSNTLSGVKAPDNGETMVIEKGGKSLLSGLKKKDPFKSEGCRYENEKCIVDHKTDCSTTGACYAVTCDLCGDEDPPMNPIGSQSSQPMLPPSRQARLVAGRRRGKPIAQYTGQTGRSLHSRALEHLGDVRRRNKNSPLMKHILSEHINDPTPTFTMKILSNHKTNLQRLITEGLQIEKERKENQSSVLNSRAERGHSKIVRINPTVTWG